MKKILITGANGQDGTSLIKFLIENVVNNNYQIYGSVRNFNNLNKLLIEYQKKGAIKLIKIDLCETPSLINELINIMPDYYINLAGQSSVGKSWNEVLNTFNTNTTSIINILDIIKIYKPSCRFFNAGSSEEFGLVKYSPQDICHPKNPQSPYAVSKSSAHDIIKLYRKTYNIFAIHAIMYNHEGIYRGKNFVTRKITLHISRIKKELNNNEIPTPLELGNLNTCRDFGDSEDYVEAIWLMINNGCPKDYIVSSNQSHSLIEFIDIAFKHASIPIIWNIDKDNILNTKVYLGSEEKHLLLKINKEFYRPREVGNLIGDYSEIRKDLKWSPKTTFENLVKKMIENDIELLNN